MFGHVKPKIDNTLTSASVRLQCFGGTAVFDENIIKIM